MEGKQKLFIRKTMCYRCNVPLQKGVALNNTVVCTPDFIGDSGVTCHYGGMGKLIPVWKCPQCGWSIRR